MILSEGVYPKNLAQNTIKKEKNRALCPAS